MIGFNPPKSIPASIMHNPAAGFLWDLCKRQGVSFKCYGEGERDVPNDNRGT